jgi:uncharacterized FAD-dependent dehydrogenase
MEKYDCIIVGSGPAGLGTAFELLENQPVLKLLILEKETTSTGGLRNDCKMNFSFPIGFPLEYWEMEGANRYLDKAAGYLLNQELLNNNNIEVYQKRAERLGVALIDIKQTHLGTDKGLLLIKKLTDQLKDKGAEVSLKEEMRIVNAKKKIIRTDKREIQYNKLIFAPGRKGFRFLQKLMKKLNISYVDNVVDIGIRIETLEEHYPIVHDYYDPKFLFPRGVRTFCTNSGRAYVVKEKYTTINGGKYFSVNGHAFSDDKQKNGLVNFAMLKTVRFTQPLASGQAFAEMLGLQAVLMGGGFPIMQRVGDFRLGKRSKRENFNDDLYSFKPTLNDCTPGDISLSMPAKILNNIWKSMKLLDTIVPGVMHPGTIMYYPEIKLYANKPRFMDQYFQVKKDIYMIGDGAGTSRGITAAWSSGIRAARGILNAYHPVL